MNDTTRRFLDAVLERVPESRIVEVRLFPAIRQGGVESGIAVLAVDPEPPLPIPDASGLEAADGLESMFESFAEGEVREGETPVDLVAIDDDASEVEADAVIPAKRAITSAEPQPVVVSVPTHTDRTTEREVGLEGIADAPTQELPVTADQPPSEIPIDLARAGSDTAPSADADDDLALGDILALPSPEEQAAPGHDRLAILCARYKLIVKGPDRGKWDMEIVHQADAPIDTLDHVIKGVVRRSGDDAVPERFTRQSLRDLLDAPAWATDT